MWTVGDIAVPYRPAGFSVLDFLNCGVSDRAKTGMSPTAPGGRGAHGQNQTPLCHYGLTPAAPASDHGRAAREGTRGFGAHALSGRTDTDRPRRTDRWRGRHWLSFAPGLFSTPAHVQCRRTGSACTRSSL